MALDGKEYSFSEDMIVIGDNNGVDDLAGIMGGERSGCDDQTANMFLEAAIFDPVRTASTGRKLNIISDALKIELKDLINEVLDERELEKKLNGPYDVFEDGEGEWGTY